jgi:hypothetical protein
MACIIAMELFADIAMILFAELRSVVNDSNEGPFHTPDISDVDAAYSRFDGLEPYISVLSVQLPDEVQSPSEQHRFISPNSEYMQSES